MTHVQVLVCYGQLALPSLIDVAGGPCKALVATITVAARFTLHLLQSRVQVGLGEAFATIVPAARLLSALADRAPPRPGGGEPPIMSAARTGADARALGPGERVEFVIIKPPEGACTRSPMRACFQCAMRAA